jgi:hypothetical protein
MKERKIRSKNTKQMNKMQAQIKRNKDDSLNKVVKGRRTRKKIRKKTLKKTKFVEKWVL